MQIYTKPRINFPGIQSKFNISNNKEKKILEIGFKKGC